MTRNPKTISTKDIFAVSSPSSSGTGAGGTPSPSAGISSFVSTTHVNVPGSAVFDFLPANALGITVDEWSLGAGYSVPYLTDTCISCYAGIGVKDALAQTTSYDIRLIVVDPLSSQTRYGTIYSKTFSPGDSTQMIRFDWDISDFFPINQFIDISVFTLVRTDTEDVNIYGISPPYLIVDSVSATGATKECKVTEINLYNYFPTGLSA